MNHSTRRWAAALLAAAFCGCATAPPTFRGQSPLADSEVLAASYDDVADAVDAVQDQTYRAYDAAHTLIMVDPYHHQPDMTTYHGAPPGPGTGYGLHHEGYHGGAAYCPPGGFGACPHGCPSGGCPHHFMPRHVQSYSYSRPANLVYPAPTSPGGAVVYPYYTHKGPSDFFRQ